MAFGIRVLERISERPPRGGLSVSGVGETRLVVLKTLTLEYRRIQD
jgi:hypothetical protein